MTLHHLGPAGDPFDLWATPLGVAIRERFYAGKFSGKAGAVAMGLAEWWLGIPASLVDPRPACLTLPNTNDFHRRTE